jgi:hypothetical protein
MLTLQQAATLQAAVEAYSAAEYQAGFANCKAYVAGSNSEKDKAACAAASFEANVKREEMLAAFSSITQFFGKVRA